VRPFGGNIYCSSANEQNNGKHTFACYMLELTGLIELICENQLEKEYSDFSYK